MLDLARYKKPLIILAVILTLGIAAWVIYFNFFTFSITGVSPDQNSASSLTPIIKIDTNKTISEDGLTFTDGGAGIVASVKPYGTSIIINLYERLVAETEYTITINNIRSTDGFVIDSYVYTFTPKDNPNLLTDEQREVILERQDQKPTVVDDPVFSALPFYTDSYYVSASLNSTPNGQGAVSINAVIALSRDEASSDYDGAVAKYKKEVEDRLGKIEGYSKEKYPITYRIQEP